LSYSPVSFQTSFLTSFLIFFENNSLFNFLVNRMFTAELAEFLQFNLIRRFFLVSCGRIIPSFTF